MKRYYMLIAAVLLMAGCAGTGAGGQGGAGANFTDPSNIYFGG